MRQDVMPIITISHGPFTGGQALAERVAGILGYRCLDREVLLQASQRYGVPEAKFYEVWETEPHWWERWGQSLRLYRITLQAALCELAQEGKLLYHGRGGQELLHGIRHVLKLYLTAPMEYRIEQVKARKGLDGEAARQYLRELDRIHTRRLQAIFGVDWRDPTRYDLVFNIAQMSLETAAHLLIEAARGEDYQPTPASEQALEDLTATARVQAALILSPRTRNLKLDIRVRAEYGQVRVTGVLMQPELEEEIIRVIKGVRGVTNVITDFELFPMDSEYP